MKIILSIVVILAIIAAVALVIRSQPSQNRNTQTNQSNTRKDAPVSQELKSEDIKVGGGQEAKAGDTVSVNYTGTLTDGTVFDSTSLSGQPFEFQLGTGQVIQGWDEGVQNMKVGGTRKLTIPPSLGYGSQKVGTIPADSTLIFNIELLGIK